MKKILAVIVMLTCQAFSASVKLDWNPPSVPNSNCTPSAINNVNIWRSDTGGFGGAPAPPSPGGSQVKIASLQTPITAPFPTTYTDTTVVDNHTYYYTISFYINPPCGGPSGSESKMSNEVQAIVGQGITIVTPVLKTPTVTP